MKVLRNKYNPNAPRKIVKAEEIKKSFDKLYKLTNWNSKITIFKYGMD